MTRNSGWWWTFAMLGIVLAAFPQPLHAAGSDRTTMARDGWPETPAGAAARRWVGAFAKGDSAMRLCLSEILAPESLKERGIEERMKNYRASHERFGTLVLASVEKSKPYELEATLMAADLTNHRFVFTVQSTPPHRLISVGRYEYPHGGGHGLGH